MAHILVLDDEEDACGLMVRVLSASGHHVQVFTDHLQALEWLQTSVPDLVLIDIKLQNANGLNVLRFVRTSRPETRVVMITCCPTSETARTAEQLGIEDYLVKPIEIDELEKRVNDALAGRKKAE